MDYRECLDYLASLGHELRGVVFTLGPITRILNCLGNPHLGYATAVVAGTNGKGSTSAMLASIMEAAGYRTGLYTSPHLVRVNERFRVCGAEIGDEDFAQSFTEVRAAVDRLVEQGSLHPKPSFFEFLTATAFLHFARCGVQLAVLEVGMGGRLDATNVTLPKVVVITNIDLDHTEFLGTTHSAIAAEKAGVIKPGCTVVSAVDNADAAAVIRRRCAEVGARLIETGRYAKVLGLRSSHGLYTFDFALNGDYFPQLTSPLRGRFQISNTVAAVTAATVLAKEGFEVPPGAIAEGLRQATWSGRLEVVAESPLVVMDGAHNPAAAREIAAFAREHWAGKRLRLVYASMRDKAIREIGQILFPLAEEVYLTRPDQPRAALPEEILAAGQSVPTRFLIQPEPAAALLEAWRASSPDDVILVAGSLFLVGAIKKAQQEGSLKLGLRVG